MKMKSAQNNSAGKHTKEFTKSKSSGRFYASPYIKVVSIVLVLVLYTNFASADTDFQIEISGDDGEMDYSVKIDYSDDKVKKYLEISDLTNVDSARIKIYGKSDNCPGVERQYIEVNDDPTLRIYFNPCIIFSSNFEWKTIDVPVEILKTGKNSFLISDESGWTDSNLWIGVDEDTALDKSEICWGANCNERSDGELMLRLELIRFEEQEQEDEVPSKGLGDTDLTIPDFDVNDLLPPSNYLGSKQMNEKWPSECYTEADDHIPPAVSGCFDTYYEFSGKETKEFGIGAHAEATKKGHIEVSADITGGETYHIAEAVGRVWKDWISPRTADGVIVIFRGHFKGFLYSERGKQCDSGAAVGVFAYVYDENDEEIAYKVIYRRYHTPECEASSQINIEKDFQAMLSFDVKKGEKYRIEIKGGAIADGCDSDAEAQFAEQKRLFREDVECYIDLDELEIRKPNNPPVAKGKAINPIIDLSSAVVGEKVVIYPSKDVFPYTHFLGNESYDPDEDDYITNYEWEFGDGSQESGWTADDVTHRYLNNWSEEYTVKLTVTDTCGLKDTDTFQIKVAPSKSPTGDTCWEVGGYCQSMKNECREGYVDTYQYEGCPLGWKCCHPQINVSSGQDLDDLLKRPPVLIKIAPSGIVTENAEGQEEVPSINLSIKQKPVEISTNPSKGEIYIESNNVSAVSKENLKIENQSLFIQTKKGYKEINVMPDEATAMTEEKPEKIELQVIGEEPIYKIKSVREAKVLWLFQTDMDVETHISAETGMVKEEKKPWWNIFVTSS